MRAASDLPVDRNPSDRATDEGQGNVTMRLNTMNATAMRGAFGVEQWSLVLWCERKAVRKQALDVESLAENARFACIDEDQ